MTQYQSPLGCITFYSDGCSVRNGNATQLQGTVLRPHINVVACITLNSDVQLKTSLKHHHILKTPYRIILHIDGFTASSQAKSVFTLHTHFPFPHPQRHNTTGRALSIITLHTDGFLIETAIQYRLSYDPYREFPSIKRYTYGFQSLLPTPHTAQF